MPPPTDKSKNTTATARTTTTREEMELLKCPRCDSPNTKFCYYNNYSLTQPRHFCKTCRRYWTKGGVLRNVPVGGGCRKSNKSKRSSPQFDATANFHVLPYYAPVPGPAVYDDSASNRQHHYHRHHHRGGSDIASSIESLSWMNQDLHWKLQQQRLQEMLFGQKQTTTTSDPHVLLGEEPSTSKNIDTTASWFLDANINNSAIGSNNNENDNTTGDHWNIGIPTWSCDMHHDFTALP